MNRIGKRLARLEHEATGAARLWVITGADGIETDAAVRQIEARLGCSLNPAA